MRTKILKAVLRVSWLLALAGILAVNAGAGLGPVPEPNGGPCPTGGPPCLR